MDQRQPMVAQVQWNANLGAIYTNPGGVSGVRWGSGTMIGPDLFLTCGHLFDPAPNGWVIPRQNGTSTAISPQEAATNMHLNFNYQRDPSGVLRTEESFPIVELIEYRLGGLDMALCRIGGSPGNEYGWSEFATSNAVVGDMLAIIGHPAGQPKRIEAGPLTQVNGSVLRYNDIDTLGGNSGSGILHSPSGRVVGVHTNGGCNSAGTGSNSGVAIAAIVAASPTLQGITPSSSTGGGIGDLVDTRFSADVLTTVAADQLHTIYGWDTARAADTGFKDVLGTALARDVLGTSFAADTGVRDQIGTYLAGDVGTWGTGDEPHTIQEGVINPGDLFRDPVIRHQVGRAGLRPFVQAGPSMPVAGFEGVAGEGADGGSLAEDLHTREVARHLDAARARYRVLDTGKVPSRASLTTRQEPGGGWSGTWSDDDGPLELRELRSMWWRRPQSFALDEGIGRVEDRAFALGECAAMVAGIWRCVDAEWVNDPDRDDAASRKMDQLRLASGLGLRVPATCMTNDPVAARAFVDAHGGSVIYKSFSATPSTWRETRLVGEAELDLLDSVRLAPVIFQELVPGGRDVRVTVVGGEVFAAQIRADQSAYPLDFRIDTMHAPISPFTLPQAVEDGLLALLNALGLRYGAADFRVAPDGELVFLEVNPAGQWLVLELATGQPISAALAALLARLDQPV
ncbi:MAG: hypothetical protein GX593_04525 [Actinomycetales bacterium]|nr:hypothetical protein [Actinomycetales bacterium]